MTGIQKGSLKEHLRAFSDELSRVFYRGAHMAVPSTWMIAFEQLQQAIQSFGDDRPLLVFMDEFSWMATPRARLLQAFEYYWNRFWKNNVNIKLVLCGSSASWMIKKLLHDKGGLHNRVTRKLHLKSFDLRDAQSFLAHRGLKLQPKQVMTVYCVMGGVPYYLMQMKKNRSVAQNIHSICFESDGLLFDEFSQVFSSLFHEAGVYEELVRLIASQRHGVSRVWLESKSKHTHNGGTLTARLQDLVMAGFIQSFLPMGHAKRGIYYRILDEYTLFYLQWIGPEHGNIALEVVENDYWLQKMQTSAYQAWRGYAFESLCYKHVGAIKRALNICVAARVGAWRYAPRTKEESGAQIDLLFDREDDAVTLCEIKCSDQPYVVTKAYAQELARKVAVYQQVTKTDKQVFVAMIASYGVKKNAHGACIDQVVTLDDLLKS